jgi:hypothetical protein
MSKALMCMVVAVGVVAGALLMWRGQAAAQASSSTIVGTVKVAGVPPPAETVQVNKDPAVCGKEKRILDVVTGPDHGLADAVVSVPDAKGARALGKATLDQKGCEFHPDVLVMAPGALDILNSDGVLHNIHSSSTLNPPFNKAQPKFRKVISEEIDRPEIIKLQCDVHAWMRGWLFVTDHPAMVTDPSGSFKLVNVPAGTHRVEVWHPVLGTQSKTIDVRPGETVTVAFELAVKKS